MPIECKVITLHLEVNFIKISAMDKLLYRSIFLIFSTVFTIHVVTGQDWLQFRGPGLDSKVTGFRVPAQWPAELKQVWKVTVGTGDASPVLVGKFLYLHTRQGGEETVLCLDSQTGKEIWKQSYPAPAVTGPAASHPGPRSTPSFSNGKLLTFGVSGILSCFEAKSGKLLWRKENPSNAVPQFFTGTSPLVTDGICIIHTGTKDKGEVWALDLNTGNEKWKWSGEGPSYSTPSIMTISGKKQIVINTESNLMSLELASGKLLWKVPAPVQQRFYNCVSPYVNGTIVYNSGQGTGTKCLSIENKGDLYTATEVWNNASVGAKWNTPVLKDGYLYGFTDTRRIYCIKAADGTTAWIDQATNSDFATLVDCGGVLIGLPSTGNLIIFKPEPAAYSEVTRYKVSETPVYAYPVISGNAIYIKDAESLILYNIN